MPFASVAGVEIAYETRGSRDGVPLLLISGLGTQLVGWHPGFLDGLVRRGYSVVLFDNRDVGRSTHFDAAGKAELGRILCGDTSAAPYSLDDLAADTAGLLDNVGWQSAHVLGVSMGGMVAQTLALRYPERVRSLTSVMSTTGARDVGQATEEATAALFAPPARTLEEYLELALRSSEVIGSMGFDPDLEFVRHKAISSWERGYDSAGVGRQLGAIFAAADRTPELSALSVPALVVHGDGDPLVGVSGGRATAAAIPGAELLEIEGMGHDLPRGVWERVFDRLDDVVGRGELRREDAASSSAA